MKKIGRLGAAAVHLIICLVIASAVIAIFWGVWFPNGLAIVAGASELLLIIIGVDVAIGPLLTLILFVPGKKGLYFDLAMIAFLQLAALGYGVYAMLQTRPVFLVAVSNQLQLVSANEIADADLAKWSKPEYSRLSWSGPVLVGSRDPEDPDRFMELTASILGGGPEIHRRPEFFEPVEPMLRELVKRTERLSRWSQSNDSGVKQALRWTTKQGLDAGTVSVVPIVGRTGVSAMLVDTASGNVLHAFGFDPDVVRPASTSPSAGP